jgi:hypothetical protein
VKIKEKVRKRIIRTVVKDVLCNLCGESCMGTQHEGTSHPHRYLTGGSMATVGGYESAFPPDYEQWRFDLCEPCLGFLVSRFKIAPSAFDMSAMSVRGGKPEPNRGYNPTLELLSYSATSDWIRVAYAKAMAKAAVISDDSVVQRATAAAAAASEELERQRGESRGECWAMHDALSAIGCPGSGSALDRIRLLGKETVDERLVGQLRQLHDVLAKVFDSEMKSPIAGVDRHEMAVALDDARAYLDERAK